MCHEKAKSVLGFNARCLFGRLARAMTKKSFVLGQIEYWRIIPIGLKFSIGHNFGASMTYEVGAG